MLYSYLLVYNTNRMTIEASCVDVRIVNNLMQFMERDLDLQLETYQALPMRQIPV